MKSTLIELDGETISIVTTWRSHMVSFVGSPVSTQGVLFRFRTRHRLTHPKNPAQTYEVQVFTEGATQPAWIVRRRDGSVLASERPRFWLTGVFLAVALMRLADWFTQPEQPLRTWLAFIWLAVAAIAFLPYVLWRLEMQKANTRDFNPESRPKTTAD
jgi:hypothetical protein